MSTLLGAAIFAASLLGMLFRPRYLADWAASLIGGLLMLATGLLPLSQAGHLLAEQWDVFLFFLGLALIAATADQCGVFEAAAHLAACLAGHSQRRLLTALFGAGILVTAILSNDATALLMTPVAFAVARRLRVNPRPYAFSCALVANAASFLLPVSNPANLLLMGSTPLSLGDFVSRLWLPSAAALAVTLLVLQLVFRAELSSPLDAAVLSARQPPARPGLRAALLALAAIAAAYLVASACGWPLGVVACAGAALLLAVALGSGGSVRPILRHLPWGLFPLFAGLLLLVGGAEQSGVFGFVEGFIASAAEAGLRGLPLLLFGSAALANLVNNLPAALVVATGLRAVAPAGASANLTAAAIVGINLGPNLTTIGSLATMLWLLLLRQRGVRVSVVEYLRVGVVTTLPALAAAALTLLLLARLLGS